MAIRWFDTQLRLVCISSPPTTCCTKVRMLHQHPQLSPLIDDTQAELHLNRESFNISQANMLINKTLLQAYRTSGRLLLTTIRVHTIALPASWLVGQFSKTLLKRRLSNLWRWISFKCRVVMLAWREHYLLSSALARPSSWWWLQAFANSLGIVERAAWGLNSAITFLTPSHLGNQVQNWDASQWTVQS